MFSKTTKLAGITAKVSRSAWLGLAGAAALGFSIAAPANQLFIQQSGTAPAGGDPNIISNTGAFVVGLAGSSSLQNPLLVIVGVYDGLGTPSISFGGCAVPSACPAATIGTYGLTGNTATFTAGSKGTAFSLLGLTAGGSESWVNWSGADVAHGFAAPTSYTLYAFQLNGNLAAGSPFQIDESGAANGSFLIAYGCNGTGSGGSSCSRGNIAQTVFTNTGLVDGGSKVPEPGTLALLAAALALLAGGRKLLGRRALPMSH